MFSVSANSKVEIRFHVESADWIPGPLKEKLIEKVNGDIQVVNIATFTLPFEKKGPSLL